MVIPRKNATVISKTFVRVMVLLQLSLLDDFRDAPLWF